MYESEEWLDPTARMPRHAYMSAWIGLRRAAAFRFSDTAPQLTGSSRNVPRKAVLATVYGIAKSMLDPDVRPIPAISTGSG